MKTLKIYENILNKKDIETCNEIIRGPGWRFGFKSDVNCDMQDNIPFWKLSLTNYLFFTETLFTKIETITETKFELLEVYCNGQTYGQDGYPHLDDVLGETHTFLYYANPNWNLTWGGKTVFLDDGKKFEVDPIPNRGILFTTDLLHYGEAFNQFCRDLRTTVCYKLKEK